VLIHALPCVTQFVAHLNQSLRAGKASAALTQRQCAWLNTVLVGILVTGTLNWAMFERRSLNASRQSGLRWLFGRAKMAWPLLLRASVACLLNHYGITGGVLVLDDTDKRRSQRTTRIAGTPTVKDQKTGG
jgi:hypothetical protein